MLFLELYSALYTAFDVVLFWFLYVTKEMIILVHSKSWVAHIKLMCAISKQKSRNHDSATKKERQGRTTTNLIGGYKSDAPPKILLVTMH